MTTTPIIVTRSNGHRGQFGATYSNGHQELVVVDGAPAVLVEGVEEFISFLVAEAESRLSDAF